VTLSLGILLFGALCMFIMMQSAAMARSLLGGAGIGMERWSIPVAAAARTPSAAASATNRVATSGRNLGAGAYHGYRAGSGIATSTENKEAAKAMRGRGMTGAAGRVTGTLAGLGAGAARAVATRSGDGGAQG